MAERRIILVVITSCLLLAGVAVVAWDGFMPYPFHVWWRARVNTRYSGDWPVSEADFDAARRLVRQGLASREIITAVKVSGPDEITLATVSRWRGPLEAEGQHFVVRRINGKWQIAERSSWIS